MIQKNKDKLGISQPSSASNKLALTILGVLKMIRITGKKLIKQWL